MAKKSIFEEIVNNSQIYSESDIKMRADHIIKSAINLLESFDEDFDDETAKRLEKRLLASIKTRSPKRFKIKSNETLDFDQDDGDNEQYE